MKFIYITSMSYYAFIYTLNKTSSIYFMKSIFLFLNLRMQKHISHSTNNKLLVTIKVVQTLEATLEVNGWQVNHECALCVSRRKRLLFHNPILNY